jgi:hypothetical protein
MNHILYESLFFAVEKHSFFKFFKMHQRKRQKTTHDDFKTLLSTVGHDIMSHLQGLMTSRELQNLSICSVETDRLILPFVTPRLMWRSSQDVRAARLPYICNMLCTEPKSLPALTHITFVAQYNQPIDVKQLPPTLTHLTFGGTFNQPMKELNSLRSLTHLTFGHCFDQPIAELPPTLTHLTFGWAFSQPIDGELPTTLTHLTCDFNPRWRVANDRPFRLLCRSLTHLAFGEFFDEPIGELNLTTLTHLTFGKHFNQPINDLKLPALTHLTFGHDFDQPMDFHLTTLTHLTFGYRFNQSIALLGLLTSLTHLTFGPKFKQPLGELREARLLSIIWTERAYIHI